MPDFDLVYERIIDAKAIAWDGCHKIYLLMDDAEVENTRGWGYGSNDGSHLITKDEMSIGTMFDTVKRWFDESCGLRFVDAVSTNTEDPNAGFETLIGQFELDDCEDCGERGCAGVCNDTEDEDEDEEEED